jgi:hypothetical protein
VPDQGEFVVLIGCSGTTRTKYRLMALATGAAEADKAEGKCGPGAADDETGYRLSVSGRPGRRVTVNATGDADAFDQQVPGARTFTLKVVSGTAPQDAGPAPD